MGGDFEHGKLMRPELACQYVRSLKGKAPTCDRKAEFHPPVKLQLSFWGGMTKSPPVLKHEAISPQVLSKSWLLLGNIFIIALIPTKLLKFKFLLPFLRQTRCDLPSNTVLFHKPLRGQTWFSIRAAPKWVTARDRVMALRA